MMSTTNHGQQTNKTIAPRKNREHCNGDEWRTITQWLIMWSWLVRIDKKVMTISIKNRDQETNKAITAMRREKEKEDDGDTTEKKKKSCGKKKQIFEENVYQCERWSPWRNNPQPKMPLKKLNVCLLVFELKIKSTMPITNKDEKERREKTRRVRN